MLTGSHDWVQIIGRVAAPDVGKAEVLCCVRVPGANAKRRRQEVSTHSTMTRSLTELAEDLVDIGVERVVMEATRDYWRPVSYLFEVHGLQPWLVNARDVKHLPGRPKTDVLDAVNTHSRSGSWIPTQQRAADIVQTIDHPHLAMLFDTYHCHLGQTDVTSTFRALAPFIAHIQIADPPHRGEAGTGDQISWQPFFSEVAASHYRGWIGCEYRPISTTTNGLTWRQRSLQ